MTDGLDQRQSLSAGRSLVTTHSATDVPDALIEEPEVMVPGSAREAAAAFGDGRDVTVFGGATTLMPLIARGTLRPRRALMLNAAGLDTVREDLELTFGAMTTLATIAGSAPEPLASAAAIPDREIRDVATIGGNLHWPGDLQAPLIALRGRVRSVSDGNEHDTTIEDYLARGEPELVLEVSCQRPQAGVYLAQRRIHSATYTVVSVALAQFEDGVVVAAGGAGPRGVRCPSVEAALSSGASHADAAAAMADDIDPPDDPLASGWYRRRILPVLLTRALAQLEERG
jgi:aerobic carbon-monoxide dehydrogenase medium subunit